MARPKKHPEEKRSERFNLRFTVAEREHIATQAQLAGLEPTEYLRRRSLGYEVPTKGAQRTDPGLVTEVNRLALELSALGNNANQIARSKNSGRRERVAWDAVVERITELGEQASEVLERLVLR